ncbi:MAG: histidine phosphatase family protein [Chloroflexi bacterium]|nr:MAG: histidine phosphatase family protein [Chloroflexota bacterium]
MQLLLIRHGETTYNAQGLIYGHAQIPLNERGQVQAHRLGQRLKQQQIHAVYSSDLIRAMHTAHAIVAHHDLQLVTDMALRELDVGEWEHKSVPDVQQQYPTLYQQYCATPGELVYPGGESHRDLQQRVMTAVNRYVTLHQKDDIICIVCHGGTIAAIVCAVLGLNINLHERIRIDNCAITTIEVTHDAMHLVCLNDNTHATS